MTKAISYRRVSTDEQGDSGLGLEAQADMIDDWAQAEGRTVAKSFTDRGESGGSNWESRPGLSQAVEALEAGDTLVIAKRDRLFRSYGKPEGFEDTLRYIKGGPVDVVFVEAAQRDDDFETDLMRRIFDDYFGDVERQKIKERTREALAQKKAAGKRVGQIPFGKELGEDGETLEDNGTEAQIIDLVCQLREAGETYQDIADRLNEQGYTNKAGNDFAPMTVSRIWKANGEAA